jgi:sugar lactone lactonase YvrE
MISPIRASYRSLSAASLDVACIARAELGEGPVWDDWSETLWWVDIERHLLLRLPAGCADPRSHDVGQKVAAVLPRLAGGVALLARRSILLTDDDLTVTGVIPVPLPRVESMRLNDGACDPAGRLWFGSMATDGRRDRASLYTLAADHSLSRAPFSVSISNGIGWAPDGLTMYYVDTPTGRIDAFSFDPDTGGLAARRTLARIPGRDGRPDGIAVDADGAVWVALWGGGAVLRITSSGRLAGRIDLPVSNVTSCCFGGAGIRELYITTATRGLDDKQLAEQPLAGALFVCTPGVAGMPVCRYGG